MKTLACLLLVAAVGLGYQSTPEAAATSRLNSTLLALRSENSPSAVTRQQLSMDILRLADPDHMPARSTVTDFSEALASALAGKALPEDLINRLSLSIRDVLHSAGTGTSQFRGTVDRAQETLASLGVPKSEMVADLLRGIGKEVRGPEDLPDLLN